MKRLFLFSLMFSVSLCVWSGGSQEESATSGKYFAERGMIIPPEYVRVSSYIAQYKYNYPYPESDVGVYLYAGHRQISASGQEEVLQIGLQARKIPFEELPPMNLAFVVDKSGSMNWENKMDWVKESFDIFISRVREQDFVSLIIHDHEIVDVLFPSTRMDSEEKRRAFSRELHSIVPAGAEQFYKSLQTGYKQVQSNFNKRYINRVLFVTDGQSDITGVYEMAEEYREKGINVTAIGVGSDFDSEFIVNLARSSGGSSRFISDKEEMKRMFGSELDRMVAPIAYDLNMELEFLDDVEIIETWGYKNRVMDNSIYYSLPTLHHGDYETIVVHFRTSKQEYIGEKDLVRFRLAYSDLKGNKREIEPQYLKVRYVEREEPVSGFSDGMILKSGTMMHFAQALIEIGNLNSSGKKREALDRTVEIRKEVFNARTRLDEIGFEDQIKILDNYIETLGKELALNEEEIAELKSDTEIAPSVMKLSLDEYLEGFFNEIALDLESKDAGTIALPGFTTQQGKSTKLVELLNRMAVSVITKTETMKLVEQHRLADTLKNQNLELTDLFDTSKAIDLGKKLSTDYILTGTVIEMKSSVTVFGRILNIRSGNVESVAQVIIPKEETL